MAEQFFPGFEDDEPKKPAAKPAAPAAPAKAFDPFAGQQVQVPSHAAPPPAAAAPAKPPAAAPPAGKPAAPVRATPPAPAPAQDEDKDVRPGSAKDLWACPHCGAGNKPGRAECRVCGKKPDDPVVKPWFKNPIILAGAAAAVAGLIAAVVILGQADLSLHDPGTADAKVRTGGSAEGRHELSGGVVLELKRRIAVSGRIVGLASGPGRTTVVALALGKDAADAEPVKPTAGETYPGGCVLACVFADKAELKPGQWLSLTGATGDLVKEGAFLKEAEGFIPVQVDAFRVRE